MELVNSLDLGKGRAVSGGNAWHLALYKPDKTATK